MSRRAWVAGALFVMLVAVGLAAADKPPPIGFLIWVLLAGLAAGIVWWRSPGWTRRSHAARDGAVVGVLAGLGLVAFGGEPSIEVPASMPFAVVAVLGVLGGVCGWVVGVLLADGMRRAGGDT